MSYHMRNKRRNSQRGISLIELMIAGAIMVTCSLGVLSMILVAIATNSRNKQDTTKTMLAQAVLEQVNSVLVGSATTQLTDCRGNAINIDTSANGSSAGAALVGGTIGGNIDFTQDKASITDPSGTFTGGAGGSCGSSATSGGYQACFIVTSPCNSSGQYVATYDIRWHVDQIGAPANATNTFLVTVGSRQMGASASTSTSGLFFSTPTNLRQFVGKPQ